MAENAWEDLEKALEPGETVEALVFGNWGWSYEDKPAAGAYGEPDPPPVPVEMRAKVLTPDEAKPFMAGWSFFGGYGSPECYAVRVWTSRRILWVTQYDGSTSLDSAMRNPEPHLPDMPGGG
jgi:hypothetical protein